MHIAVVVVVAAVVEVVVHRDMDMIAEGVQVKAIAQVLVEEDSCMDRWHSNGLVDMRRLVDMKHSVHKYSLVGKYSTLNKRHSCLMDKRLLVET